MDSALYFPRVTFTPDLTNHQAMEGWAIFPEVERGTSTVDLTFVAGLPTFSGLPVDRP
jgi:hypothetical protein